MFVALGFRFIIATSSVFLLSFPTELKLECMNVLYFNCVDLLLLFRHRKTTVNNILSRSIYQHGCIYSVFQNSFNRLRTIMLTKVSVDAPEKD